MPRIDTVKTEVFKFSELSEEAQRKAIDGYRENNLEYEWWDTSYEHYDDVAKTMGITIDRKGRNTPTIYFSGFSNQGDGACFEGTYRHVKGNLKNLKKEFPARWKNKQTREWVESKRSAEAHDICSRLNKVQRNHFYQLEATVKQSGHYMHSGCTQIDVQHAEHVYRDIGDSEQDIKDLLREFMDWIYAGLEAEHDYLQSDAAIIESIDSNETEFTADGSIY